MSTPNPAGVELDSELYTFEERISMLFGVEAAGLSAISIVLLIGYKIYRTVLRARAGGEDDACDSSLFLSLMLGESLRAIGKIMTIRWIIEARTIAPTTYCTAQGVIQLLGTNLIDWSTLAITVQTTMALIAQWGTPTHFAKYLVLAVWVIVSLIVGIALGVRGIGIIGPADGWCWVQPRYRAVQILSEYLWMWIICVLTAVCYGIDVLVVRGFIIIDGWRLRWVSRNRVHLNLTKAETQVEHEGRKVAKQLFFYPLVYFICVMPFTITRWLKFTNHSVAHQGQGFTTVLFSLSGFFNVILFFKTRPELIRGGDIQSGPVQVLPNLHPLPHSSTEHVHGQTSASALLRSQREMVEKQRGEDLFLEINYSQGRHRHADGSGNILPTHRQVSRSPSATPMKYN